MIFKTKNEVEEVQAPEPKVKPLFREFVAASNWQPSDGPTAGVFLSKPAGSRCLWSVKWGTVHGLVEPDALVELADATDIQVIHEAHDCSSRGNSEIGQLLMTVDKSNAWKTLPVLRALLEKERAFYPEYVFPDMPPPRARLGMLKVREGWGTAEQIFAKSMGVTA